METFNVALGVPGVGPQLRRQKVGYDTLLFLLNKLSAESLEPDLLFCVCKQLKNDTLTNLSLKSPESAANYEHFQYRYWRLY